MEWKDNELTDDEIKIVSYDIKNGKIDEALDLMGKDELNIFKDKVVNKEVDFSKTNNDTKNLDK